ncbi:MAG: 3-deoxy-D-manno-octulosonic acid transferase [Marinibacterium sp.]|nr:3-deoxy-D-manno-octulosonic acid transferase [Marinibacterium sp.]
MASRRASLAPDGGSKGGGVPPGVETVWAHATSDLRYEALDALGTRLQAHRPDLRFVLTADPAQVSIGKDPDAPLALARDVPTAARRLLDRYQPDLCLWTGGALNRPALHQASKAGADLLLTDVSETTLSDRPRGVFRNPMVAMIQLFDQIFAETIAARLQLERLGALPGRVSLLPALQPEIVPPACNDSDLRDVGGALAGRRLWLAAHVAAQEAEAVIKAHRHAARRSPHLLLVLVPDRIEDAPAMRDGLKASGLRWADFDDIGAPDDTIQVLFSEDPRNLALWYRVAALCFLGCSLWPGLGGRPPLVAATLGAAIICGPNLRDHLGTYEELTAKGAAQVIRDPQRLGETVLDLLAADRAARMALAAWDFATRGAPVSDHLLGVINARLDARQDAGLGGHDARA